MAACSCFALKRDIPGEVHQHFDHIVGFPVSRPDRINNVNRMSTKVQRSSYCIASSLDVPHESATLRPTRENKGGRYTVYMQGIRSKENRPSHSRREQKESPYSPCKVSASSSLPCLLPCYPFLPAPLFPLSMTPVPCPKPTRPRDEWRLENKTKEMVVWVARNHQSSKFSP